MSVMQPVKEIFQEQTERIKENLSKIKNKIAIISGKGGVGKTTLAVNLSALLAFKYKTGLLDADIDCPNVNKALGIKEMLRAENERIIPIEKYGIKVISMASIASPDQPIIFRGPRLTMAVRQFLELTEWGDLDYLIIDLPPGTGDIPLTVMQLIDLKGVIIVTTPQDIAVGDARRVVNMTRELKVPVFGIVENMSGEMFGIGGGEVAAKELKVPFLGRLDLNKKIREYTDKGIPAVLEDEKTRENFKKIFSLIFSL